MLTLSRKFLSPLSFPTPSFFSLLVSPPFSQLLSPLIPANSAQSIVFDSGTSVILDEQIQATQVSQSVRNTKAGLRGSGEVAGKPRLGNRMTEEAKEKGNLKAASGKQPLKDTGLTSCYSLDLKCPPMSCFLKPWSQERQF